jgi:hypothetical protein
VANDTTRRDDIGAFTLLATDNVTGERRLVKVNPDGSLNSSAPGQTGTWSYYAGASGNVNVTAGQRVIGIAVHSTAGGSFTINGGASIPVPANSSIEIQPLAQLVAPAFVFTGTDSYFVEVLS